MDKGRDWVALGVPEPVEGRVRVADAGELCGAVEEAVEELEGAVEEEQGHVLVDGVVEDEIDPLLDMVLD